MNVTFYTETIKSILNQANGFASGKQSGLPILNNVVIKAQANGYVSFTSFDLITYATINTQANVVSAGDIIVNCASLLGVIKSGNSEVTTLETVNAMGEGASNMVRVTCGSVSVNLNLETENEYPEVSDEGLWNNKININGTELIATLDKLLKVVSKDEVRPVLCGIHFQSIKNGTLAEATDGYRLTRITLGKHDPTINFIMPGSTARGLKGMIAPDMMVQMYQREQQLKIMVGQKAILIVQLTQGDYPKTETIIPAETDQVSILKANRKEFIRQLQSVVSFKPINDIVSLKSVTGGCELQANGMMGNITTVVPAIITGTITTAYNVKYLLEIMKAMSGEMIEIKITDPLKPGVIQEPILTKALSIIMPVKIRE